MKFGLVLGGGGLVGMAYHAGALKALSDWGADVSQADLVVGTSAGAVIGAYLRAGWEPGAFFEYAQGRHGRAPADPAAQELEVGSLFVPLWSSRAERARRMIGSAFAVAAARGLTRSLPPPPPGLRRLFPAGLYSAEQTRARLRLDLPEAWPERDLYLCAVELYTGRRVPFGHPDAPPASLPDAVLASTAIPGVFPPVRIGESLFVDGGVATATSLDLAVRAGCDRVLCIAPLGYRRETGVAVSVRNLGPVLVRSPFARSLRNEVNQARAEGVEVFVVRPWLADLAEHGTNSMRRFDRAALSESARAGTMRLLEEYRDHPVLSGMRPTERKGA